MIRFVATSLSDNRHCRCESCGIVIAEIIKDEMIPPPEECYRKGNVPVPNLGWFCSQQCAVEFEEQYNVTFLRTKDGKIDYYSH